MIAVDVVQLVAAFGVTLMRLLSHVLMTTIVRSNQ